LYYPNGTRLFTCSEQHPTDNPEQQQQQQQQQKDGWLPWFLGWFKRADSGNGYLSSLL